MIGPLYLNAEGYEEEVELSVNTILGVVFPKEVDKKEESE